MTEKKGKGKGVRGKKGGIRNEGKGRGEEEGPETR